jgi:hypothetical protein
MPTQGFRHESVYGTMAGERLTMSGSGRRGWRAVACAALLLAVVPPLATLAIASAPPGGGGVKTLQLSMEPVHDRVADAAWRAGAWIVEAYQRSPVLVLGLAIAGALPLLAGFVALGRAMRRRRETVVVRASGSSDDRARIGDRAWIEIARGGDGGGDGAGDVVAPVMFSGELLRIGRHSDNDIALDHASVHRHHALIQRTPDQEFVLVDLTAGTGNVLLLNDRRVDRAILRDGDRITLGETGVTFHIGAEAPVGSRAPQTNRTSRRTPMETRHVERDARDEPTGRAADRIETRRLDAADRVAARRPDRGRA